MNDDLSELRNKLEKENAQDARRLLREAILGLPSDWRASLWKLDVAVGYFAAWYLGKLLGRKDAFIEPEVIEEWRKHNEQPTNRRRQ